MLAFAILLILLTITFVPLWFLFLNHSSFKTRAPCCIYIHVLVFKILVILSTVLNIPSFRWIVLMCVHMVIYIYYNISLNIYINTYLCIYMQRYTQAFVSDTSKFYWNTLHDFKKIHLLYAHECFTWIYIWVQLVYLSPSENMFPY